MCSSVATIRAGTRQRMGLYPRMQQGWRGERADDGRQGALSPLQGNHGADGEPVGGSVTEASPDPGQPWGRGSGLEVWGWGIEAWRRGVLL